MKLSALIMAAALPACAGAIAQTTDHAAHHAPPAASAAAPTTDGEVRKVDRDQGRITLRHGPIANLDMPAMTMVFKVGDPKLLDALKPGDKVRFSADNLAGVLTVTALEPVR